MVVNDRWGRGCRCHHGGVYTGQDRYNPGQFKRFLFLSCNIIVAESKMDFSAGLLKTLLSQVYKWGPAHCFGDNLTKCWEVTCDELISHPVGIKILLAASYYVSRR